MTMRTLPTLLALTLAACAAPTAEPAVTTATRGTLHSGAKAAGWSSEGPGRWSVELRGTDLVLRHDDARAELLGAGDTGALEFLHEEPSGRWLFVLPDGRTLAWRGRELEVAGCVHRLEAGAPFLVDLRAGS